MKLQAFYEYSQVANRRGGGLLLIFRNFSDPELIKTPPRLFIFKKKNSDQDIFTPDLQYFQFFLSKYAYLTPI